MRWKIAIAVTVIAAAFAIAWFMRAGPPPPAHPTVTGSARTPARTAAAFGTITGTVSAIAPLESAWVCVDNTLVPCAISANCVGYKYFRQRLGDIALEPD